MIVQLYSAERYDPTQVVGARTFNVLLNGFVVAKACDIWVAQGSQPAWPARASD